MGTKKYDTQVRHRQPAYPLYKFRYGPKYEKIKLSIYFIFYYNYCDENNPNL